MSKLDWVYQLIADRIGFGVAEAVVEDWEAGVLLGEALAAHGLTVKELAA